MQLLDEQLARIAIREGIARSRQSKLAVAFWGSDAIEQLGIDNSPSTVSVVCNLRMGGTNPVEISRMRDLGVNVRQCDDLHGKVYLFDDAVLIGSSNASSNGLGFQDGDTRGWREANVFSDSAELVAQARLWIESLATREITDRDIALARVAWSNLRSRPTPGVSGSLLHCLKTNPTFFEGKKVFLTVCAGDMDREGEQALKKAKRELAKEVDAFEDWPELPSEGFLVSFAVGPRGAVSFDNLLERRLTPPDRPLKGGRALQLCWPVDDIFGLTVSRKEVGDWAPICRALKASDVWGPDDDAAFLSLEEVCRQLLP